MASIVARADRLRSLGFGSITSSYTAVGTPFQHAMRMLKFTNNTDGDILVSFDGVNDNLIVPAGSFDLYDFTTNRSLYADIYVLQNLTQVYVKYLTAPTTGAFYSAAFYAIGE